jgi:hypothetical protein
MSAELGNMAGTPEEEEWRNWLRRVLSRRVGMVEEFGVGRQEGTLVQVWFRKGAAVLPAVLEVENEVVRGVYLLAIEPGEADG